MSVTAPKPTQTPIEAGIVQIEAKHRDIEAEIDAKVKDPERYRHYIGLHDAFPLSPKLIKVR